MSVTELGGGTAAAVQQSLERQPIQTLGQEEFIKILVAQMTSQDPLNPQKDTEFIAQMAQFSALENSRVMQAEMEAMRAQQDFLHANTLLGRRIELTTEGAEHLVGTVTAVRVVEGEPLLVVGGQAHPLSNVLRVWEDQPSAQNTPQHAE